MCAAGVGGRGRGVQACSKRARRSASLTLRCSVTLASSPAAWTSACGAAQGLSVAVTSAERRWWCAELRVQGEMGCGASREGAGLQRLEALDVLAQPRVPAPREREVDAGRPLAALLLGERAQRRHGEPQVLLALEAVDRDQPHRPRGAGPRRLRRAAGGVDARVEHVGLGLAQHAPQPPQQRKGGVEDRGGVARVDEHGVRAARRHLLEQVERQPVQPARRALQRAAREARRACSRPAREQLVGKVAVEEHDEAAEAEERHGRGDLVHNHHVTLGLGRQQHERAVERAQRGADNVQAAQHRAWQPVAGDPHRERAVARLLEAAARVVVRSVHHHRVAASL